MENLIGNTPMIKINYEYLNKKRSIYVKVESYNLTGSIKDRMAYFIIQRAKEKKWLEIKKMSVRINGINKKCNAVI